MFFFFLLFALAVARTSCLFVRCGFLMMTATNSLQILPMQT